MSVVIESDGDVWCQMFPEVDNELQFQPTVSITGIVDASPRNVI